MDIGVLLLLIWQKPRKLLKRMLQGIKKVISVFLCRN